jgi:hypothetical protein
MQLSQRGETRGMRRDQNRIHTETKKEKDYGKT